MKGTRILVWGFGRSGQAAVKALLRLGAQVCIVQTSAMDQGQKDLLSGLDPHPKYVDSWDERLESLGDFVPETVVTSPGVDSRHPFFTACKGRGIDIWSEIELAYRLSKAPIVAVTGTNGKSTTVVMTYLALIGVGEKAVLCGNLSGSGYPEQPLTEAAMNSEPDQVLVAEISSFQLEWIEKFAPASAGITTIVPDHLDRYDSFTDYAKTKLRIFENMGEGTYAVTRALDLEVKAPKSPKNLEFGAMGKDATVGLASIQVFDKQIFTEQLKVLGSHNHANLAMALLLSYGYLSWRATNEPESNAARVLAQAREAWIEGHKRHAKMPDRILPFGLIPPLIGFRGIENRMEYVGEKDGVLVVNNSMCTNVDAILKSATSIPGPKHVLMGGINKDLDFSPLKSYFGNGHHKAYLYGRDGAQLQKMLGGQGTLVETLAEAFEKASAAAKDGEVILLAPGCASMDQFKDFRHRGSVFKELACRWIQG